jgi:hypothetical protein
MTLKDTGISPEALKALLEKRGLQIVDMRSFTAYEPKLFG